MNDESPAWTPTSRQVRRSESIGALAAALATAQGEMKGAVKDSENPFFKSKYADLAAVWDACRAPLAKAQIAVMQFPRTTETGIEVETILAHASGEWLAETLELPAGKLDAQGLGSAITYARRYALAGAVGIAPEDDDGLAAADSVNHRRNPLPAPAPKELDEAGKKRVLAFVALVEKEALDVDSLNAACRQEMSGLPRGILKESLWNAAKEHAKQQGWRYSPKAAKFVNEPGR